MVGMQGWECCCLAHRERMTRFSTCKTYTSNSYITMYSFFVLFIFLKKSFLYYLFMTPVACAGEVAVMIFPSSE